MLNANEYFIEMLDLLDDNEEENAAMMEVLLAKLRDEKVTTH